MRADVDYYAILGVLPTAEDIVIRAAYRALAQRYHPDKFQGGLKEAETRMREINEAYEVLSDPTRRASYDHVRSSSHTSSTYFSDNEGDVPPDYDPLRADWLLALEYYPDLSAIERRLARISWRLAYSFKAYLIDAKFFDRRASIAERMEQQFLEAYFGSNAEILDFARVLIESGNKPAARALNDAVRVLGSGVPPGRIIDRVKDRFDLHEKPPPVPPPPSPEEVARRKKEHKIGVAILLGIMIIWVVAVTAAFIAR